MTSAHRTVLSYRDARGVIMHELDLYKDAKGLFVWDRYCQRGFPIHAGEMPSPNELNIEHTWPQSRFNSRYASQSKSDLHHLFPTDSMANGLRGHMEFGTVVKSTKSMPCPGIKVGYNAHNEIVFEGPVAHRGDMARAIFYFAVRYEMHLSADEEATLRAWHAEDPVSEQEMERNDKIEQIQGNRNPFIDHPEYVDQIARF